MKASTTIGAAAQIIQIDRLYEETPGSLSRIIRVLELLKQASENLTKARAAANPIDADELVQRTQLMLPKLFAERSIGDGFATIINSLHFALLNQRGLALKHEQLDAVWRTVREVRERPAITVEQAIHRAEELEDLGLKVDPPDVGELLEELQPTDDE